MKDESRQSGRTRGFSLVELLVVIAVISLLAALLFPALKKAKDLAKSVWCMNNWRQIHLCVELYKNDVSNERWPGLYTNPDNYLSSITNDLAIINKKVDIYHDPALFPDTITYGWNPFSRGYYGWNWLTYPQYSREILILGWCEGAHARGGPQMAPNVWQNNNVLWGDGHVSACPPNVHPNVNLPPTNGTWTFF